MDNQTFHSRLMKLIQKSRKALRLYSSVGRLSNEPHSDLSEMQIGEWKAVNAEIVKHLTAAIEHGGGRSLITEVHALRDRFYNDWRVSESDLRVRQKELIIHVENGDFIKVAMLARALVSLKARMQACQAAQHELGEVVKRGRVGVPPVELGSDKMLEESAPPAAGQRHSFERRRTEALSARGRGSQRLSTL